MLVGLGNPGQDYARNRHNIGFMAVDRIVDRHNLPEARPRVRPRGSFSEGRIGGSKVIILKPLTYMNESGQAVGDAMRYYRLQPEDVFVFHDEIDLAPAKVRVKQGGGHAGHNGLRNIEAHIGKDYWRIRLGVGHPGDRGRVTGHVLGDFSKADKTWLDPMLEAVADEVPLLIKGDTASYTSRIALKTGPVNSPDKPDQKGEN